MPTGLMTPTSEETTAARAYLSTDEEIHLMRTFVEEVAIWMDVLDSEKHFVNTIPCLALKLPMLLNALLACGARHLTMIGVQDNQKAEYCYDLAIAQLQRNQEGDCDLSSCALTAVVLDAYHIMDKTPAQSMRAITSTRVLIQKCGWDASSTGLPAACFWVNTNMEVLNCISLNRPTSWNPDEWGMDLEFTTLAASSHSGSRSELGDVLDGDGGNHALIPDTTPESGDEELWLQRIFYVLAKVVNFRASDPRLKEPSSHDEDTQSEDRFAQWNRLQSMCKAWNDHCPRSMKPYGYSSAPSAKSLFPNVWLLKPPQPSPA
ncbi:hypothetical protein N0V88_003280 [Collariella sp. IMI 366227]|nr:hypothetical protein N0V88_003280 [Collariella sp. IMI 366227]